MPEKFRLKRKKKRERTISFMRIALLALISVWVFIQGEMIRYKCGRAKEKISRVYGALRSLVVGYQWQ